MSWTIDNLENLRNSFIEYVAALRKFNLSMRQVGISTFNVDPLANFAEVIVAFAYNGKIERATNKGFDVLLSDGRKIQVKSLKVSSSRPGDNWLNWYAATRLGGKPNGALIDADLLAVVVYLDSLPFAQLVAPIIELDAFPVIGVKDLCFRHVQTLLAAPSQNDKLFASRIDWMAIPHENLRESDK